VSYSRNKTRRTASGRPWLLLVISCTLLTGCSGCTDPDDTALDNAQDNAQTASSQSDEQLQEELFENAIDNLNRLEKFDSGQMPKMIARRLEKLEKLPDDWKGDRLMLTWPRPEMLGQVVSRLDRWLDTQRPTSTPAADPMLQTLPKKLADLPQLRELERLKLSGYDAFALREAVWLREISNWASGDQLDDLPRAQKLFDWTVRNIQLDADLPQRVPLLPWENLFYGRGTSQERAWVFILLARQQGIDAALLAVEEPAEKGTDEETSLRPWVVGVSAGGEVYLFDPLLGLPIPAADGVGFDAEGNLSIEPATLAQVLADEKLLRGMDIEGLRPHRYSFDADDMKRVVALVEASPAYLTQRMSLIESRLTGKQKTVLTASPVAQAERFAALEGISRTALWQFPFEVIERRVKLDKNDVRRQLVRLQPFYAGFQEDQPSPLRTGRMLHLKGQFTGPRGATFFYQQCRPADSTASEAARKNNVPMQAFMNIFVPSKLNASYWLGQLVFERGNYPSATNYFYNHTLVWMPDGMRTHGAKYNLGRTYERSGEPMKAALMYKSDPDSPAYQGNLIRARWLEEKAP
jgi:hypothetical protein